MRVTSAFSRLLRLPGVWVKKVRFEPERVIVEVALRPQEAPVPEVFVLDVGAQGHAAGGLGVAAPGSGRVAA